ncbi:hypothetical protein TVAG_076550 [Trichomonas vaginalis G3]|uniref:DUF3447 domain-containing protein n=1 Tax=Trichomonas vaginalis (strain ATCC PRA-98 / G3) TaxID=412133 RepID=A2D9Q2_TRIV3|nr:spectrin binding [Trichomonas vaginalis G3]EAY22908.1 hypothetical protein TVAG_076550 [Trichomonas vaginalis G3]KAI5527366.1 spectrin binding [Trichomonas vaginalis G3]|eukprot:XP_001583894.1 hypothetical protein [Trichomonas vaginalis G3]
MADYSSKQTSYMSIPSDAHKSKKLKNIKNPQWTPGKIWSNEELSNLIKIDYNNENYNFQSKYDLQTINSENVFDENCASPSKSPKFGILSLDPLDIEIENEDNTQKFIFDDDMRKFIKLQDYILDLTDDNFNEFIFYLTENNYFNSIQGIIQIIREIPVLISTKRNKLPISIRIIDFLISKINILNINISNDGDDGIFSKSIDSIVLGTYLKPIGSDDDFLKMIPQFYLLKHLLTQCIFSSEQIISCFEDICKFNPTRTNYQNLFFCYFANNIEENRPELYTSILKRIDSTSWYSSTKFKENIIDFYFLKANNWENMNYLTSNGYLESSIEEAIYINDESSLKKLIQKNDKKIESLNNIFLPLCSYTNKIDISIDEYACLCGSFDCLDFLENNFSKSDEIKNYFMCFPTETAISMQDVPLYKEKTDQSDLEISKFVENLIIFRKNEIFNKIFERNEVNLIINELLCSCCYWNYSYGVEKAVKFGASINYKSKYSKNKSPIHFCCLNGNREILSFLLSLKTVLLNAVDDEGNTALHICARNNFSFLVSLLLQKGSNPNVKNKNGQTPLHEASINGCIDCCRMLVNNSMIDINIKDNDGMTAIMCANRNGQSVVNCYLLAQPTAESDISQRKMFIHKKMVKSHEDLSRSDFSTDDLSQDFSIESILLNS